MACDISHIYIHMFVCAHKTRWLTVCSHCSSEFLCGVSGASKVLNNILSIQQSFYKCRQFCFRNIMYFHSLYISLLALGRFEVHVSMIIDHRIQNWIVTTRCARFLFVSGLFLPICNLQLPEPFRSESTVHLRGPLASYWVARSQRRYILLPTTSPQINSPPRRVRQVCGNFGGNMLPQHFEIHPRIIEANVAS